MWTRYDLKMNAKRAFQRNYWTCVAVSLLTGFLTLSSFTSSGSVGTTIQTQYNDPFSYENYRAYSYNDSSMFSFLDEGFVFTTAFMGLFISVAVLAVLYAILVGNIIIVGGSRYYMENREHMTKPSQIFYGFRGGRYGNIVVTMFFRDLYIFLWTLLFIIPGIIKSYSYKLVPYILAENPNISRKRALDLSRQMMDGHKMEVFILELSFLGWTLLSAFTCNILFVFYVSPYMDATFAEFYAAVKSESMGRGIVAAGELPGYQTEMA